MKDLPSMPTLADLERMVDAEFARIPPPVPPRELDELPELEPKNPHDSRAWDRTHAIAALTGIVAGLYFC